MQEGSFLSVFMAAESVQSFLQSPLMHILEMHRDGLVCQWRYG